MLLKPKSKAKTKLGKIKSKDETDKPKEELAAFVEKAVQSELKQELKSIDKKCKRNSEDQ